MKMRTIKHFLAACFLLVFATGIHAQEQGTKTYLPKFAIKIYGAGISYGYHWILKNRWSMEATIGAGYARLNYDKYACGKCGEKLGHNNKNYFGPTKIGLSIIYTIK